MIRPKNESKNSEDSMCTMQHCMREEKNKSGPVDMQIIRMGKDSQNQGDIVNSTQSTLKVLDSLSDRKEASLSDSAHSLIDFEHPPVGQYKSEESSRDKLSESSDTSEESEIEAQQQPAVQQPF